MAVCIINGRRVEIPDAASAEDIASAGGIRSGRRIIRQTREGNYPMKPGERVTLSDGDLMNLAKALYDAHSAIANAIARERAGQREGDGAQQ
jgi:hypothetical protein